jgi:hypothetical protein
MALPDFSASFGFALMRQDVLSTEWFFVDWVNGEIDEIVDYPGEGTFRYEVWAIIGASVSADSVTYADGSSAGIAQIVIQQLKR